MLILRISQTKSTHTVSLCTRETSLTRLNPVSTLTQVIENTWMRAKQKLRRLHGTSVELFASYMAEFMWRCRVGDNKFAELILAIRQQYPF